MDFVAKVKTLQNYFKAGNYKKVLEGCAALNRKFPNNSFILNLSGMAFQNLHNNHKAISFFELAIKADNSNIAAMNNMANSLKNIDEYAEAEKVYKKILTRNPDYINAYNNYAKVYDDGTLIHHWVVESQKDSSQTTIYDVISGNHAALQNATVGAGGIWNAETTKSYLAEYGGYVSGVASEGIAPFGATANANTFNNPLETVRKTSGVNVVINGDASDTTSIDSAVAPLSGWSNVGTHNVSNKVTIEEGKFRFVSDGTYVGIRSSTITAGNTYKFACYVPEAGKLKLINGGSQPSLTPDADGNASIIFTAANNYFDIARTTGAIDVNADNFSVQEYSSVSPDTFLLNAPETIEFADADTTSQFIDVSGNVLDIAPEDIVNTDQVFFGSKNALVYKETQTDTDKINNFIG